MHQGKGKGQWSLWDVKGHGKPDGVNAKGVGEGKTGKSGLPGFGKGQYHHQWSSRNT